jgi:hypothetical protein
MIKEPPGPICSPAQFKKVVADSIGCAVQELSKVSRHQTASVLLPIQWEKGSDPVILLNKRSSSVRQPGDLCCPGGRVDGLIDEILGALLRIPILPFPKSRAWRRCAGNLSSRTKRVLSVFWAACLRESCEEMGLLPWRVEFLGVLPLYRLLLFQRQILPMVGWIHGQTRFKPNWEVERILPISLEDLLNPANYVAYRIKNHPRTGENVFPAYLHQEGSGKEILWGATYWIVESFLRLSLKFQPPPMGSRPLVEGELPQNYLTGGRANQSGQK